MPLTINKNVRFSFSLAVSDPNGLSDIKSVYYEVKDPSGNKISNSQGISKFPLFDDGKTSDNSDITGNDGIFSVILNYSLLAHNPEIGYLILMLLINPDLLSNTIIHTLKVN